ncbi:MAG TPA: ATP-binding protein [Gemmatimonadaceae bacterium]|nr:ATP-binding protein [Gemmatimonadaceae bacterium]
MTRRIVVTGPECTGKTSLARALAERLGAPWLPEAARGYAEAQGREERALTARDVEPISRRAIAAEDEALESAPGILVLDTDLLSTVAYARHYYGACPAWIEGEARARRGALYLLCAPDLPWRADGVRDRPAARAAMHEHFRAVLREFGAEVIEISGVERSRERAALAAVETLAAKPAR